MSGIVGIINTDGAPVDRGLLRRMTEFMSPRGPDAQDIWIDGPVGFGHTMLRTTWESEGEVQPRSLGGELWITADARIDGRAELIKKLNGAGFDGLKDVPDADLILRAYVAWGEDCLRHLIGDFSFAIWDAPRRRLFCARDHFGVRPFYYAKLKGCLIFSNTLNCLRLHPAVSDELNERAVGDFLLFGVNYDPATTVFADIMRLPPAHHLTWSGGESCTSRYWSLPTDGRVRYRRGGEYVEHFKDLLDAAVEDRLRTERAGIFMSGGLDSPAVAATARGVMARKGEPLDLRAYTVVYENLIPDDERRYAGLAAEAIGIPVNYIAADGYKLLEHRPEPEALRPEPVPDPLIGLTIDQYRGLAAHCRVALYGHGPDAVLSTHFPAHTSLLVKKGKGLRALMDVARYAFWHRQPPPVGVRTLLRRRLGKIAPRPAPRLPSWLHPDFVSRVNLAERFRQLNEEPGLVHPRNPVGYNGLASPFWPHMFELDNADVSRLPVENRYPFFDVRLVSYLLAIPPTRWCVDKKLLRVALKDILPETVRLRPKTPLPGNVLMARVERGERPWLKKFNSLPGLSRYVISAACFDLKTGDAEEVWEHLRLRSFADWMAQVLGTVKSTEGENHVFAR